MRKIAPSLERSMRSSRGLRDPLNGRTGPRTCGSVDPMTDPMVRVYGQLRAERVEVITSVQRRRRWSTEEKVRIVEETYLPRQLRFHCRSPIRHQRQPALHLAQADGPRRVHGSRRWRGSRASLQYRAAQQQIRELQRLLGKKTLENEILREAVERVTAPKKLPLRVTSWPGDGR